VIGETWIGLPDWLRLIVTTRTELDIREYLSNLRPFMIEANSPFNLQDISLFLRNQLTSEQVSDELIKNIVDKSEGMFLYAYLVIDEIRSENLSKDSIEDFPQGLKGYYKRWFKRKFPNTKLYHDEFHKLVSVIVAQKSPLPLQTLSSALGLNLYNLKMRLRRLGVLFPLRSEKQEHKTFTYVVPMHKSLLDWLTGQDSVSFYPLGGEFASDLELGNHLLAEEGWRIYKNGLVTTDIYFKETILEHLAEDGQSDKLTKVLFDAQLVDNLWCNDKYRVEWQRLISSQCHELSLSKLIKNWLIEHQSKENRTNEKALVAGKLCRLLQETGAFDEALALGKEALEIWNDNKYMNSPEMVDTYLAIGKIHSKRDQLDKATESHEKALEISTKVFSSDSPQIADVLYSMCEFYNVIKRDYKKATECLNKCYDIWQQSNPPNIVGMANCVNDRAVIYTSEGKSADMKALYSEALSLFEKGAPYGHPEMVPTLCNLGNEYSIEGKNEEALYYFRRSVIIADSILLPQHENRQAARHNLSTILLNMGRYEEGLEVLREFVSKFEHFPGLTHEDTASARVILCNALWLSLLASESAISGVYRDEIRQQCQLFYQAKSVKPNTIVGLLSLAENMRRVSEMGLYDTLRKTVQTICIKSGECYCKIVEQIMTDQPVKAIEPAIIEIWKNESPKMLHRSDTLSKTRKAITYLIAWYGNICLEKLDDIDSVGRSFAMISQIGAESPDTLDHLSALTMSLHRRHIDNEILENLCVDLLNLSERILGLDHIQTVSYLENVAFIKMYRNKLKDAKKLFQRALEIHTKKTGIDNGRAIAAVTHITECLLMLDLKDDANIFIHDFATKISKSSGHTTPQKKLAEFLNQAAIRQKNEFSRFGIAKKFYKWSLEYDSENYLVHNNIALLLWACINAYDEANYHFKKSLDLNDRIANTHSVYGLFLGQTLNNMNLAIEHLQKATSLNPHDPSILANYASVLLVKGELEKAWKLAKRGMRFSLSNPDRITARILYSGIATLLLVAKDPTLLLGQLKTLFLKRIIHAPWIITKLHSKLQQKLSSDSFHILKAISEAIENKKKLAQLEQSDVWKSIDTVSLEIEWPKIIDE